jgi:hypothetical protein
VERRMARKLVRMKERRTWAVSVGLRGVRGKRKGTYARARDAGVGRGGGGDDGAVCGF